MIVNVTILSTAIRKEYCFSLQNVIFFIYDEMSDCWYNYYVFLGILLRPFVCLFNIFQ